MAEGMESMLAVQYHVMLRFAKFDQILALVLPTERALYICCTCGSLM